MHYTLRDLIDIPQLQALLDSLSDAFCLATAITETDGTILTASGWQDVCIRFHRTNPEIESLCRESDCHISDHVKVGKHSVSYRCPMGLIDCATSIMIDGRHQGNAFVGQFFLDRPDPDYFREQARRYGFAEDEYVEAIGRVPILSDAQLNKNLRLIRNFAEMLAGIGLTRLKEMEAVKELKRHQESLESQVAQRTADLTETCQRLQVEVAERKAVEEAIADQNRLLEAFFENTLTCNAILDCDFNFLRVNHSYAAADNRTIEEFPGRNHFEIYPSDALEIFQRVVATGQPFEVTARPFVYPDNPERGMTYWDWTLVPIADESGMPKKLIFTLKNVTEHVRIGELNHMLSQAVDQSPISIVLTNTAGEIVFVNRHFTRLTGYEKEEVLGRDVRRLESETPPDVQDDLWATISSGNVWSGVLQNRKKSGETLWEQVTVSPILGSDGTISHYMALKEDITERKALEAQLFHAQKMEAIGHLAGGIAHDFNNILTGIIGFANLIEMHLEEESRHRRHLRQILVSAERAAELTCSLLAFSRKQIIKPQPVSLVQIILKIETFLQRIIGEDIQLQTSFHGTELRINADSGQIEQVLMNLATNARDAMPTGGTLSITTEAVDIDTDFVRGHGYGKPGAYALVSISDTGSGMDEATRKCIFEPFFTTKEVGKGSGLGMSIVYGIVKQHEGFITVYSEPGLGTRFSIYLPLIDAPVVEKPAIAVEPPLGGTETILVADDDPALRDLAAEVLGQFGYTVITAANGEEALDLFRRSQEQIDLVILDMIMPRMNGKEVFEEIKRLRPCKALFFSGYTAEMIQQRGLLDESLSLVTKPLSPQSLLKKIREVLDEPPVRPSPDHQPAQPAGSWP